ncbi:MAG: glutamine amidotransferase [Pseudomonadota bacterium]
MRTLLDRSLETNGAAASGALSPKPASDTREKILIVLHQESSTPGRIGQMLIARGYTLDIRRPALGDPLPETMIQHKGAIIFGGPMSCNDPDEFVRREIEWCGVSLKERAPFLGICLGAQMLVKHLGGKVEPHPEGCVEVGYYPIHPVEDLQHDRVMPCLPSHFYQWHKEGFELPAGTTLLARGDLFENQAYRVNGTHAYGIQFHTELTLAMLHRWTVKASERLSAPGAKSRSEHLEGRLIYDKAIRSWLSTFLDQWLDADPRQNTSNVPNLRAGH